MVFTLRTYVSGLLALVEYFIDSFASLIPMGRENAGVGALYVCVYVYMYLAGRFLFVVRSKGEGQGGGEVDACLHEVLGSETTI